MKNWNELTETEKRALYLKTFGNHSPMDRIKADVASITSFSALSKREQKKLQC